MNIGLIIAGGSGERMGQDIPKQFMVVKNKPVIIYTLQAFQQHPSIDTIVVVCLDGWQKILEAYCREFGITKLEKILTGGKTGQESICNGVTYLKDKYARDDIVLIHDAIRPMVSQEIISDCLRVCQLYGNATTTTSCMEAMFYTQNDAVLESQIARNNLKRTQTPQAANLGKLVWAHEEAERRGIHNSIATCTLLNSLGETVYTSKGSEKNLKLTTPDDVDIFMALLEVKSMDWMK